jgi:hypothetical protein
MRKLIVSLSVLSATLMVTACGSKPSEPAANADETVVSNESGAVMDDSANMTMNAADNSVSEAPMANASGGATGNAANGSEPASQGSNGGVELKPH